jgi:hypothetical protein
MARRPDLWAMLDGYGKAPAPGKDSSRPLNIDLGQVNLYPEDAAKWTAEQLEGYFKKPDRLAFPDPAAAGLGHEAGELNRSLDGYIQDNIPDPPVAAPVVDVGYAFIFGVGLGYHLPELVARNLARHLVLIEPVPEFLFQSLSAIDWQDLFTSAERRGTEIHFRVGKDPERTILEIEGLLIHGRERCFLDGAYAYVHYYSWALRETRALLNRKIMNFIIRPGDLDDEAMMMENAYGNLSRWPFRLVEKRTYVAQGTPVLIVGSGPSLDLDMEALKELKDRAVVVSCGSALGILLKNGIRPDLHVENENTQPLVENLKNFYRQFGFDGIALLASITVPPEVGSMFGERWFYYRAPLSPSAILIDKSGPLLYCGPLVANAAAAALATLGFREIYLFGVDCGQRQGTAHHAKDAVYFEDDYDNFIDGEGHEFFASELDREVPGNFGGTVSSSAYYDLSRRTFTELQRDFGFAFFNCGDGAKIDGARPKAASSISLAGPAQGGEAVLKKIGAGLKSYAKGEMLEAIDLKSHMDACRRLSDGLKELTGSLRGSGAGFWELGRRMEDFKVSQGEKAAGVWRLVGGSLEWFLRLGIYKGVRIPDSGQRDAFFAFYLDRLDEAAEEILGRAETLLGKMK